MLTISGQNIRRTAFGISLAAAYSSAIDRGGRDVADDVF